MKLLSKLMDSQDDLLKKVQDLEQIVDQLERISISKSEVDEGSATVDTSEKGPDLGSAAPEPKAENPEEGRQFDDLNPEQDKQWPRVVHISDVQRAGVSTLNEGERVSFDIAQDRGKTHAANLKIVWSASAGLSRSGWSQGPCMRQVDTPLPERVRFRLPGQPVRLLRTVGESIDFIQELTTANSDRWQTVQEQLFKADETRMPVHLIDARKLLVNALREEGWLYDENGWHLEAATFRNQLDALSIKFVADFRRREAKACAEAYTEDAVRIEIAAGFQAAFDAGRVVERLTTTRAESDGNIGYAVQTVHGKGEDGTIMLALRCDEDGIWLVCCEAVIAWRPNPPGSDLTVLSRWGCVEVERAGAWAGDRRPISTQPARHL
jgi:cold shock protein